MPYAAKKNKSDKKTGETVLKIVFLLIIALCLIVVTGAAYMLHITGGLNYKELDHGDLGLSQTGQEAGLIVDDKNDDSITNIALFGIDLREGESAARSDTIMIVSVDKRHNKIKLSSIMRDTLVDIEGYGQRKINAAYFYGGPQLAVKTLNQCFDLHITEYATANFNEMAQMIDAIGGVEIDVTEEERLQANISIKEQSRMAGLPEDYIKTPGLQTLNGTQAVAFARIRHAKTSEGQSDDFGRTDRQREVLSKMFDKLKGMSLLQYPGLAKKLLPLVETSLDMGDLLSLAGIMLRDVEFQEYRFPTNETLIGNGSIYVNGEQCLYVDLEQMKNQLQVFIYADMTPEELAAQSAG